MIPMKRSVDDILADIAAFAPPNDEWLPLDALLVELFADRDPATLARALPTLFGVFERFPEHDGYGVFWTLLHGIEAIPGYEAELVASLRRKSTEFGRTMVKRLRKAGIERVEGVDLASFDA